MTPEQLLQTLTSESPSGNRQPSLAECGQQFRTGMCLCSVPVVFHYGSRNQFVGCRVAAREHAAYLNESDGNTPQDITGESSSKGAR